MNIELDDVYFFNAVTTDPTTGDVADADGAVTFKVYEEDNDTAILSGTMTKRTGATGEYRGSVTVSAANGFEVGKWYGVTCEAMVGGRSGKVAKSEFRVVAAGTSTTVINNLSTGGHTFRSAYQNGVIEIVENADYRSDTIVAIRIPRDGGDWPDDLSGYTLTLTLDMVDAYVTAGGTALGSATLDTTSVSYSGTGTNTILIARPGTATTSTLCPTTPSLKAGTFPYEGQVWATAGTNNVCLWSGPVKVLRDVRT